MRSIAEKPTSSGVRGVEHDLQIVAHRSRLPAEQRADRARQPVVGGRTQHLALRHHRRQVAGVARIVAGSGRSRAFQFTALAIRIGIGNAELRQDLALERFHGLGVVVVFVIVADQVQEAMHRQMAEVMVERLLFVVGFRRVVS